MRSWIAEFLRAPYSLPPDPGPGDDRISLTLPAESVHALAGFLRCSPSEALRRLALKATRPSPTVLAAQRELERGNGVWAGSAPSTWEESEDSDEHPRPDVGDQVLGLIVSVVICLLCLAVVFFFSYRKGKLAKENMTT